MKIRRLRLENWRGVSTSEVDFDDGVTIVAGPNEVGKSSLIEALRFLFRFPDNSSHRDIEAVRPVHADESPAVELEAELGELRIQYAKRFKKAGRSGETTLRIEVDGRNPEQLTGRDAHDRAEALLGEDIDVALWEALQVEQGTGISQASLQDKRGLQEALDAAAGAESVLNADDALLIDRAEQEYAQYFTAKGKPRDAMANLPRAIDDASARKATIETRLDEIQAAADRHESLSRQLVTMRAQLPELKDQSEKAANRLTEVQKLEVQQAQAALAVKTLEDQVKEARGSQKKRERWRESIEITRGAVESDKEKLETSRAEHRMLKQRLAANEQAQADEKARREEALGRARIYRAAIERSGLKQQLGGLQAKLKQVDAIDEKRVSAQALADGIALEPSDIDRLRDLERAVFEANAATSAVTPTVQLTAHKALDLKLRGDALQLDAGETREDVASSGFSLELPGLLTVGISTTTEIEESLAAAEEARKAFESALSDAHVSSITQADQRFQEKQQAKSRVKDLGVQRADWLDGRNLDDLRGSIAEVSAKITAIDTDLAGQDVSDDEIRLREGLNEAESVVNEAQAAFDQAVGQAAGLRVQLNSIENDSRHISEQLKQNEAVIAEAIKSLQDAQASLGDEELEREIQNDERHLAEARAGLQDMEEKLQAADPESVGLLAENAKAALDRQKQEIGDILVAIGQLEGELAQARREGLFDRLSEVETELVGLTAEFRRVERRALAAERLLKVLDAHRAAASRRYVRPLKDKIDTLGRLVFGPTFSVDIGSDLSIENRSLDGISVPFDSLSGGAREQLGILARLAASQIVAQQSQVPLVMDDTLGFTDDDRLTRMGAAIASVARDNQVIILTCMPTRFAYIGNATTVSL